METTSTTPAPKKKRAAKAAKPSAPRVIDPGIQTIRDEASARVQTYRGVKASERILRVIVEKRLPKLTIEDCNKLADELRGRATTSLLKEAKPWLVNKMNAVATLEETIAAGGAV